MVSAAANAGSGLLLKQILHGDMSQEKKELKNVFVKQKIKQRQT